MVDISYVIWYKMNMWFFINLNFWFNNLMIYYCVNVILIIGVCVK